MWDVFLSYAKQDGPFAHELSVALKERGLEVWFDQSSLVPGAAVQESIEQAMSESSAIVAILSPAALDSPWTSFELRRLLERERTGDKLIIPVWHQISARRASRAFGALAELEGVSTEPGIPAVADAIVRAIRPAFLTRSEPPPGEASSRGLDQLAKGAPATREQLMMLTRLLTDYFSEDELQMLCFTLSVDYDELRGGGTRAKARELCLYLDRRKRLSELVAAMTRFRPDIAPG